LAHVLIQKGDDFLFVRLQPWPFLLTVLLLVRPLAEVKFYQVALQRTGPITHAGGKLTHRGESQFPVPFHGQERVAQPGLEQFASGSGLFELWRQDARLGGCLFQLCLPLDLA
jgi:hypothetical protein